MFSYTFQILLILQITVSVFHLSEVRISFSDNCKCQSSIQRVPPKIVTKNASYHQTSHYYSGTTSRVPIIMFLLLFLMGGGGSIKVVFFKSHNYLRQFLKGIAKINIAHKPVVVFYFTIIHVSNEKHCISVQRHWIPCGWFVIGVATQILFKIPFSSRRKTAMPVKVTKFRSPLGAYGL